MKVKDLIEQLKNADPEAIVVVSRDSEGNDFSECDGFETGCFINEGFGRGYFKYDRSEGTNRWDLDPEDTADVGENGAEKCVCFWPK